MFDYRQLHLKVNRDRLENFYERCKKISGIKDVKLEFDSEDYISKIHIEIDDNIDDCDLIDYKSLAIELSQVIDSGMIKIFFSCKDKETGDEILERYDVSANVVIPFKKEWIMLEEPIYVLNLNENSIKTKEKIEEKIKDFLKREYSYSNSYSIEFDGNIHIGKARWDREFNYLVKLKVKSSSLSFDTIYFDENLKVVYDERVFL